MRIQLDNDKHLYKLLYGSKINRITYPYEVICVSYVGWIRSIEFFQKNSRKGIK